MIKTKQEIKSGVSFKDWDILDGRTRLGRPVKKLAKPAYFIFQAGAVIMWSALICYGLFS